MVRRKNSAEMLDVLRRVAQEEKARRLRQAQKEEEAASRGHSLPPDERVPVSPPPQRGSGEHSPPSSRPESRGRVLPPADGFPEEPPAEVPRPGRFGKTFLSVLSGGRSRRPGLEEPEPDQVLSPAGAGEGTAFEGEMALAAPSPPGTVPSPPGPPKGTVPSPLGPQGTVLSPLGPPKGKFEGAVAFSPSGAVLAPPEGASASPLSRVPAPPDGASDLEGFATDGEAQLPAPISAGPPAVAHPVGKAVVVSPPKDWPTERRAAPPARPLFGEPADERGLRPFLSRAARAFWGDGISGGLRQRVEVKVATIGVYAAVALAAMLAVALIMNQGGGDRREKLLSNSATDQEAVDDAARTPAMPIETLPVGSGPGPEVRHITVTSPPEGTPSPPSPSDGTAVEVPPAAAAEVPPAAPAAPEEKVFSEVEGPAGWYVQIQSMVRPEHADLIVDHVKALGFRSIWKRPMVNTQEKPQKGKPVQRWFLLRLGPYSSKDEAVKEKGRFLQAIGENPLKNPKRLNWDPFPTKYP